MFRGYVALMAFAFFACTLAEEDLYPDKYDYIDVDTIMQNDRQRDQYYKCFMDLAPCVTPDATFFKDYLPEAIATKCRKCTDRQKEVFNIVSEWYSTNRPDEWRAFVIKMLEKSKDINADTA